MRKIYTRYKLAIHALLIAGLLIVPQGRGFPIQCIPVANPCLGGTPDPGSTSNFTAVAPTCSPIIFDLAGNGFNLTSFENGVQFDISGTGRPIQIAWTSSDTRNAFLVLDRDGDGKIDNGKEMFGNFTPQPPSAHPNGFLALAEFDKAANGGNGDGVIDAKDAIFGSLRLWVDANHDGISQPNELYKLADLGVFSISLSYKEARRMDRFGNQFRYRGKINVTDQAEDDSTANPVVYDVFLTTGNVK
jgi:hypothetical protein